MLPSFKCNDYNMKKIMLEQRQMSKKLIKKFIEVYRANSCLWDIKSKDYTNRRLKKLGYEKLIEFLKPSIPEADKDFIVKKINTIRCCFRKEHKKVLDSIAKSGGGTYKPTLWYYNLLLFTVDAIPISQAAQHHQQLPSVKDNAVDQNQLMFELMDDPSIELSNFKNEQVVIVSENVPSNSLKYRPEKKKSDMELGGIEKLSNNLYMEVGVGKTVELDEYQQNVMPTIDVNVPPTPPPVPQNSIFQKNDEFDTFGILVASRLRKIAAKNEIQQLFCENIINLALMKGLLLKLTENSTITS